MDLKYANIAKRYINGLINQQLDQPIHHFRMDQVTKPLSLNHKVAKSVKLKSHQLQNVSKLVFNVHDQMPRRVKTSPDLRSLVVSSLKKEDTHGKYDSTSMAPSVVVLSLLTDGLLQLLIVAKARVIPVSPSLLVTGT